MHALMRRNSEDFTKEKLPFWSIFDQHFRNGDLRFSLLFLGGRKRSLLLLFFWDNCSAAASSEVELWCRPSLHSTVSLSLSTGKKEKKKKEEVKVRLFPPSSAAAERAASFHPSSHSLFHFPSSLFFLSFFSSSIPSLSQNGNDCKVRENPFFLLFEGEKSPTQRESESARIMTDIPGIVSLFSQRCFLDIETKKKTFSLFSLMQFRSFGEISFQQNKILSKKPWTANNNKTPFRYYTDRKKKSRISELERRRGKGSFFSTWGRRRIRSWGAVVGHCPEGIPPLPPEKLS